MKHFIRWRRLCAMVLTLLLVVQALPLQGQALAAETVDQKRYIRVEPTVFQPSRGETTTIRWNWEIDHLTVIKLISGERTVAIIQGETEYAGGYVPHEFVWNGQDEHGNLVPEGTYDILVEPQDRFKPYASVHPVTILGEEAKDIAIIPNPSGDRFVVYGQPGGAQGVTGVTLTVAGDGSSRQVEATVEDGRWLANVALTPYTQTSIQADIRGARPGQASLNVTNHPFRFFDELSHLALQYYGDARFQDAIALDNQLSASTEASRLVGQNILMINQAYPVRIDSQDPVLGGNMGIIDLFSGMNTNTPAHMGMGNNVGIASDLYIGGSFPLFFTRTYNSRDEYFSELGSRWSHTFGERLRDLDKAVLVRFEDGHIERYDKQSDGSYRAGDGIYNRLTRLDGGGFELTTPEQAKLLFSQEGLPVRHVTAGGVELRLTYDGTRLESVEREGNKLQFHYNDEGWLVRIGDQTGRSVAYVNEGRETASFTDVDGTRYDYRYDDARRLTDVIRSDGTVMRHMEYDGQGRLTQIRFADGSSRAYAYDEAARIVTMKEGAGLETRYFYDADLRLTKIVDAAGERTFRYDDVRTRANEFTVSSDEEWTNESATDAVYASGQVRALSAAAASACAAAAWDKEKAYVSGDLVSHNGRMWQAKWWTQGEEPGTAGEWGPWEDRGACGIGSEDDGSGESGNNQDDSNKDDKSNEGSNNEGSAPETQPNPCGAAAWDKQKVYVSGDLVTHNGRTWQAQWWTQGEEPGIIGAWKDGGACGGEAPEPTPGPCGAPAWDAQKVYNNGDLVTYRGRLWQAKWWTLGEEPGRDSEWGVWQERSDCGGEPGGPGEPGNGGEPGEPAEPDPQLDEAIWAPDNGIPILRAEMFNFDRSDPYNTLYPWYRLHNVSDRPIALSDIRIRYFFTADSKDKLLFWGDWASIGSIHIDGKQRFRGRFIPLQAPGVSVDTVLEMSFEPGSGVLQPGQYVEMHTRISKERWADFAQSNDYSFNPDDTDFDDWNRIAVFVRGEWVWGSMPIAAALEVEPPAAEPELTIPDYHSKKTFVESGDARGGKTHYVYDDRGNLLQFTDALGNTTAYTYNEQNRLTSLTDALGRTSTYVYDDRGNLLAATDGAGRTTRYAYNDKGLRTEIALADGTQVKAEYDDRGNAVRIIDGKGNIYEQRYDDLNRLVEQIDPQGSAYRFAYDAGGRIEQTIDPLGQTRQLRYNGFGQLTDLIDEAGGITVYRYNEQGLVSELVDPLGHVTSYSYDDQGRLQHMIAADGGQTSYEYDLWNRVAAVTDAEGQTIRYQYDANGNRIRETDARGGVTEYRYDLLNQLVETIQPDGAVRILRYDAAGQLIESVDAEGGMTRYAYDGAGQLIGETDALGHTIKYSYTPTGLLAGLTDPNGNTTQYEYDATGNLTAIRDALGQQTVYTYDASGRLTAETNALGQTTAYTYDALGQRLSVTDPGGNTTRYSYTPHGQIAGITDPLGRTTAYAYDALGQLTEVQDALGYRTLYQYDAVGNLIKQIRMGQGGEEQVTQYAYDQLGRRIAETNPLGLQTHYRYDANSNLTETVDPAGVTTRQTYDANDRVTQIAYSDRKQASFAYNKRGELIRMEDWNGVTQIERDTLGQISGVTDPKGRSVHYTWTPTGQKASLTTPDGRETTYQYDALNRLIAVKDQAGTTTYAYNAIGQVTEKTAAGGSITRYAYTPRGQLQQLSEQNQAGEAINRHEYRYDAAGNILNWIETIGGERREKSYTYDELNQLIQAIDNGQARTYRYDGFGNRIGKTDGNGSIAYTYNGANQLLEEKAAGVQKKYEYDLRGNLTGVKDSTGQLLERYSFDETNRLVQAVKDGKTYDYRYNAQGVRIQSKTADKTQDFVTDLTSAYNDLLAVYEGESLQASYSYGINRLHALLPDGESETYSYDHLGSIVGLQDSQGNLTETYRYDEFGVLQNPPQRDRAVNFAYTGYPYEGNGLYFAQARYYKAEIGRFVSEDAYEGSIWVPQSHNLLWVCLEQSALMD
ncbi:carbohydrate-binding protein [Paenibacillus sp. CECT 9249]|uniref:carbohydrate-binding protein n=1 Tax=Paenibacillus sp. CECT 9249 TaxID=2845385 RepID=UPI0025B6ECE2|nr:carbohydrate-binding protein [Paenibacillus sp. CECT 9249]